MDCFDLPTHWATKTYKHACRAGETTLYKCIELGLTIGRYSEHVGNVYTDNSCKHSDISNIELQLTALASNAGIMFMTLKELDVAETSILH